MEKLLLLDNYDSFTYNLYHLIKNNYPGDVIVKRNTDNLYKNLEMYKGIIIGPGPGNPKTTQWATKLITKSYNTIPILGVCLGMQCLNNFFGGTTIRAPYPIHGKQDILEHNGQGLFKSIPNNFLIARYHSLIIEPCSSFSVNGRSSSIPMAIEHKDKPIFGVQFHPESFLTEYGDLIIKNFIEIANA